VKTTDLTPLHKLAASYLSSQLQFSLRKEQPNIIHKPVTWGNHIGMFAFTPIPGLDAKGVTPELLPNRLNF
jgi:hypothetical protein